MNQDLVNKIVDAVAPTTNAMPALYAALARAQGKFKPIPKNREASIRPRDPSKQPYKFRYADLEATLSAVREPLSAEGLALFQLINGTRLTTILAHKDGGVLSSEFEMAPWLTIGDPKNFGITVAYFRRYQVNAILCLAADDDLDVNDEEGAEPNGKAPAKRKPVSQPKAADKAPAQESEAGDVAALTKGQLSVIRAKLKAGGLDEAWLISEFDADDVAAIPAARCNDVLAAIKAQVEGRPA